MKAQSSNTYPLSGTILYPSLAIQSFFVKAFFVLVHLASPVKGLLSD
jgi:hypothetical protein